MMDDTNPFAPTAALPHTENPAEPPAAEDTQPLPADATISPAVEKFKSCRWRATPDVGEFCTHRDVLPFAGKEGVRPEIWSVGHRNIQSATLNPATGELWEVEHGTRGGDEINIARKGKDYGWPTIAYGIEYQGGPITGGIQQQEGMEQPRYYWDPVIAPSGMVFYTGKMFPAWRDSLFIGGLGSLNLVRVTLKGEQVTGEERLLQDLQPLRERIRDVRQGPDGALYLLTDGPKGRLLKLVAKGGA